MMTEKSHEALLQQDTQALVRLAKLSQALKHLGEAAEAVNLEAVELAGYLNRVLDGAGSSVAADKEPTAEWYTSAYEATEESVSLQDMERRQRYYAGLPPVDEQDAAFQRALRESERRSRLAQGGLSFDEDDD